LTEAAKEIRKAATVLLLRPADPFEVFMVQRPGRGTFPNLHVFPGGKVDDADDGLERFCAGLGDAQAAAQLALPSGGLRYWVTAIRECFEECGVLLAYRDGALFEPNGDAEAARFDEYRNALAAGDLDLAALAEAEGLRFATDRVLYFSHWITPPSAPARFDTRFFVAAMPAGQRAVGHERETVSGSWVAPHDALAHQEAGRWQMIHPTLTTLGTVAEYDSVEAVMRAVAERSHIGDINANQSEQGMQAD
jgi:8-oxo-dGTP pyrophosphatase MutT (NUDIX family)